MKILDYFAAGIPVISTSKGIEGIPARHGQEALIIDEWPAMAAAITDLVSNREKSGALGRRGRAYAEMLSWDEIAVRYQRVYGVVSR